MWKRLGLKIQYAHVEYSRTLVGLCDGVVCVVRRLCTADDMTPLDADLVSGLHVDDFRGYGSAEARVAGEVRIVDVLDGVVGVGASDANELTVVLTIHSY